MGDAVSGELDLQRITIGGLEEPITQDSVNSHSAAHDRIGPFVLFQIHAHILPHEEVSALGLRPRLSPRFARPSQARRLRRKLPPDENNATEWRQESG